MVMPGGRDPSVQSLVGDLTGFLRRNLPQQRRPVPARPMPPATGMDPEGLGRALLGPNASPEEIQRMLASIAAANANDPSVDMAGNLARTDPFAASLASKASTMPPRYDPPKPPAQHWTQGVAEQTYPLGRPTHEVAGMTLGAASLPFMPLASPLAGAIGGGLGGLGSSVYNGARTPTEAFVNGGIPGAMMGLAGAGAHRMLRGAEPMPSTEILEPDRARRPATQFDAPMRRPMVDAEAMEGMMSPAGVSQHSDPYFPAPGPMPRNDRNVGGQFIRPWRADEIQGALTQPAGLPQPSLLQRFEGEMARTQPGSPIADAGLRGMDPGDWFAKTQPDVGMAGRLEGAIPQQDAIMEMLRRQAPNPLMQPAGMPDPDGLRAFFQALSGLRGR